MALPPDLESRLQWYGRYAGEPNEEQLHRFFRLDELDREHLRRKKGRHNRLGYAVQLVTVRFLGTFLVKPLDVPPGVLSYVSRQLGYPLDAEKIERYNVGETRWDHQAQIRRTYGYKPFTDVPEVLGLVRFLYARVRLTAESPSILFDLATARLVERKVLLPGVTTLMTADRQGL